MENEFAAHCKTEHNGNGRHAMCTLCDAYFEQKTYLRLHAETNCGQSCTWNCPECGGEFISEIELNDHIRSNHAIISIDENYIKLEENPLILPEIKVSSIEYMTNGIEDDFTLNNEFDSRIIETDAVIDDGNTDAQIVLQIDIKPEYDPFEENHVDENNDGEKDEKLNEIDYLNMIERWTQINDNKFKCNICQLTFDVLEDIGTHVFLHGEFNFRRAIKTER